jgi:hypothetical protein
MNFAKSPQSGERSRHRAGNTDHYYILDTSSQFVRFAKTLSLRLTVTLSGVEGYLTWFSIEDVTKLNDIRICFIIFFDVDQFLKT